MVARHLSSECELRRSMSVLFHPFKWLLFPCIVGALPAQQYHIQCRQLGSLYYTEWADSDMEPHTCCQHHLKRKPSWHYQGKLLSIGSLSLYASLSTRNVACGDLLWVWAAEKYVSFVAICCIVYWTLMKQTLWTMNQRSQYFESKFVHQWNNRKCAQLKAI